MQMRQGDVLVEKVEAIPTGAERVMAGARGYVLAEGEATGHAHTIAPEYGELYEKEGVLYLKIEADAPLVHQEHATVTLPRGTYRVKRQVEYTPQAIRNVAD